MKKIHLVMLVGVLALPLLGIGTVYAINKSLTKNDEIKLKQEMKPQDAGSSTQLVGIFAPGFEAELADAKAEYASAYGDGNFQVLSYNGYTLLVPPNVSDKALADAKTQVDNTASNNVDSNTQVSQIAKIREAFDVEGAIIYTASIGAYTDEKGFQYNFQNGELVSKQVGITSALHAKFEQAYPYLKAEVTRSAVVSSQQARATADQLVNKLFAADQANNLKAEVQDINVGDARVGFIYGDKQVHILVDQVSGDVIGFNKETN